MLAGVVWAPQPGSQTKFLECPLFEVLYEGTRGPGKTDALIMDFASETGQGLGEAWRGILFRRSYPELADVIAKTKKWYSQMKDAPSFNEAKSTWTWPTGEQLLLRHMARPDDYWSYHGHEYPWIGWEEVTTWPNDECYVRMMSCCRSSNAEVARRARVRSTTNPYGVGHNWVKERWQLPRMRNRAIMNPTSREGEPEPPRMAIHGTVYENKRLLDADPNYISRLRASARNEAELKAWLHGSWDIVAGGMFDDVWNRAHHVILNFPIRLIPDGWRIDRSFDWGSSKPFSVGWWAESNGEPLLWEGRTIGAVRGDLIRFAEWYGWTGRRNEGLKLLPAEVAQGIIDREDDMGIRGRTRAGPADSAIWDASTGVSIEATMRAKGVTWTPADKGPGSRKQGWEAIRQRLKSALPPPHGGVREAPGLFVCDRCIQFQQTLPFLSRWDKDMDDVDTEAEDHIADEVRYRVRRRDTSVRRTVQ
jgi:hypothetical protein